MCVCYEHSRVPQFLVDASPLNRVVVAQPRRLSAVSLARRVASERKEGCGASVGFRVGQVMTMMMLMCSYLCSYSFPCQTGSIRFILLFNNNAVI
jgi:hypothetical protein